MKKTALIKDILRDIRKSKGRFFSIVIIIALGVAFFFGLKMTPESMWLTADKYYDEYNLMDIRLVSTLGITEDDVSAVEKVNGVKDVFGTYSIDVLSEYDEKEFVLKTHGYSKDSDINNYKLIEGRMPEKSNEAVLEKGKNGSLEIPIGTKIDLSSGTEDPLSEDLKNIEYKIVGLVQTPYYLSYEKGNSNIGNGEIKSFIAIPQENFKSEIYTDMFLTLKGAKELNSYNDKYFDLVDPVAKDLEELAKERQYLRYEEIIKEGKNEIDEGREEYLEEKEKAEKELDNALEEIEKGKKEIKDGRQKIKNKEINLTNSINEGEIEIEKAETELRNGEKQYEEGFQQFENEKASAEEGFRKAEKELEQGEQGIKELEKEINSIKIFLENPKLPEEEIETITVELRKLEEILSKTNAELEQGKKDIKELEKEINSIKVLLENPELPEEEITALTIELEKLEEILSKANSELEQGKSGKKELGKEINTIKSLLENPKLPEEEITALTIQLRELEEMLSGSKSELEKGRKELEAGKNKIAGAEKELNETKKILDSSKSKLETEKANLAEGEAKGRRELENAKKELDDAKIEIEDGEKEYEEEKEKAEEELEKALEEIEDGEKELRKIEKGKWHVLDREKHYSYMDYGGAADRMDALARVFPIFFALVAALVCLTSMTRMVDEQRINIGTFKALGYSTRHIAAKYMFYASTATILGVLIGLGIGYVLFPTMIFDAYGMMYMLPDVTLAFNTPLAIGITLGSLLLTTGTTFIASSNELRETPSILMRPKAPKTGKRILLERIPLIWDRFNFSYKVTIRNIFRYKRRFFMTVFGIAGCAALMLTAFGIRDSIQTVVDQQYGSLYNYDVSIGLDEDGIKYLDENDGIESYESILREAGELTLDGFEKNISIIVPKNIKNMEKFIRLQDRKTEDRIDIPDEGAIITEQISRDYNIKVGDEIPIKNGEGDQGTIRIDGITENYTFNFVYMSQKYYEEIFPKNVEYNEAMGINKSRGKEFKEKLSKDLLENEEINNIEFNSDLKEDFEETISSIIYVVLVMIVSAGALAFVVLYNLTNVNISERVREIATIKVLGFYDGEVSAYIYRENIILTSIGIFVGLIMGKYLHRYIMTTVEMEDIMFGLKIDIKSYFMAIVLTIVFSVLVNIVMHYKLKDIEMVESLKSLD